MKYLLIFLVVFAGLFVFLGRLIRINSISCTSQFGMCGQNVWGDLEKIAPAPLGLTKKKIKAVLDVNLYVRKYSMKFVFPGKIRVDILEINPDFALKSGDIYALVNDNGVAVGMVKRTDLVYVEIFGRVPDVGDKVGEKELFSLRLVKKLFDARGINKAHLTDNKIEVVLPEGVSVIFPIQGSVDELVTKLDVLIFKLNNGQTNLRIDDISEIDLRFKNPILK